MVDALSHSPITSAGPVPAPTQEAPMAVKNKGRGPRAMDDEVDTADGTDGAEGEEMTPEQMQERIDELEKENADLRKEVEELRSDAEATDEEVTGLRGQVKGLSEKLAQAGKDLAETRRATFVNELMGRQAISEAEASAARELFDKDAGLAKRVFGSRPVGFAILQPTGEGNSAPGDHRQAAASAEIQKLADKDHGGDYIRARSVWVRANPDAAKKLNIRA